MIFFTKQLFDQKKIRRSFNSDNQYGLFSTKHYSYPITFIFTKTGLVKCKKRECLNYSTYGVCGDTFAVSAYASSLTLFLQLQKDRHSVDFLELSNFGTPSGSGTKKGYRRMRSKNTFDKGAKKTKLTKRSIISSISSTDLTILKSLIKCNNQLKVPLGQSIGPEPPQPELQLQPYELIKRC